MEDDGRLELGDGGFPVDSAAGAPVPDDEPEWTSPAGRLLDAALTGGHGSSALVRGILGAALAVALVAALVISTRGTVAPPNASDVRGVSARVVTQTDLSAPPRIIASYAVSAPRGTASVRILGLSGAAIARAVEAPSVAETESGAEVHSFIVEPACDRVLGRAPGSAYELVLSPVGDGAPATSVASFDGADTLTAASVRACWASVASASLRVVSVAALPARGPWIALDVVLRNSGNLPMSVTAIDVANVDTLSMADSRVVAPRTSTSVHVRLPIATCTGASTASPVGLTWSVGPQGDAPSAFASTTLTQRQRATIATAARARCGTPPVLSVTVLRSTTARDDAATDARGLSVSLRVRVTTDATGTLVLGDDATRLTSDARPEFTSATVRPVPSRRCGPRVAHPLWSDGRRRKAPRRDEGRRPRLRLVRPARRGVVACAARGCLPLTRPRPTLTGAGLRRGSGPGSRAAPRGPASIARPSHRRPAGGPPTTSGASPWPR